MEEYGYLDLFVGLEVGLLEEMDKDHFEVLFVEVEGLVGEHLDKLFSCELRLVTFGNITLEI
jgi:hypothetical protein